jgi:excisionase family DNA binding protein
MGDGCPLLAAVRDEVRKVLGEARRPGGENGRLLVTVPEAAELLSLGQTEVYALVQRGELASVKIGRARRIVYESLAEWVREMGVSSG